MDECSAPASASHVSAARHSAASRNASRPAIRAAAAPDTVAATRPAMAPGDRSQGQGGAGGRIPPARPMPAPNTIQRRCEDIV